jgi:hypothetical protein
MKIKTITITILMCVSIIAHASNVTDFQELSNKGALEDPVCVNAGGTPVPVRDEEMTTIIRNAKNVDGRLYYQNSVYVMYGTQVKGSFIPKVDLTLCKF